MIILGILLACGRPSSSYEVDVHGNGVTLDAIQNAATPMGGYIEYSRFRLWGSYLGHGFTGLYGDTPYVSGTQFTLGISAFSYPPHPSFDRVSSLITGGPAQEDDCYTLLTGRVEPYSVEYVDVGDHILLQSNDVSVKLARDPVIYPNPAGEIWYVGYGAALLPVLQNYPHAKDTWPTEKTDLAVSFPGTLPPSDTMVGAIPYPTTGTLPIPAAVTGVHINDVEVNEASTTFAGPWNEPMTIKWQPASHPLTVSVRALAQGEAQGSCSCDADCGSSGLVCKESQCLAAQGSSDAQIAEMVCTLSDDGEFTFSPDMMTTLVDGSPQAVGYLLVISRIGESQIADPPDVLSHNGRRLKNAPIRTRGIDAIITRLEVSQ